MFDNFNNMLNEGDKPKKGKSPSSLSNFDEESDKYINTTNTSPGHASYNISQYDKELNITPDLDLNEARASKQTNWDKVGNGVARLPFKVIGEIGKMPGYLYGAGEALVTGDISSIVDNGIVKVFEQEEENLKKLFPIYTPKYITEGSFLQQASSLDFYMNEGVDGLGFMISAMAPGGVLKATGVGSKVAKGLGLGSKAAETMDLITATTINTVFEAGSEAKSVYDQVREGLNDKVISGEITQDEANRRGALAAKDTFLGNTAILIGPNLLMNKYLFGSFSASKKASNSILKEAGKKVGVGILSEGVWEEGSQLALENYAKKKGLTGVDEGALKGIALEYLDMLNTTEGQKSMFLGGLMGSMGGAIGGYREARGAQYNNLFEEDKDSKVKLNPDGGVKYSQDKINDTIEKAAITLKREEIIEKAITDNNPELFGSVKNDNFLDWGLETFKGSEGIKVGEEQLNELAKKEQQEWKEVGVEKSLDDVKSTLVNKLKVLRKKYDLLNDNPESNLNIKLSLPISTPVEREAYTKLVEQLKYDMMVGSNKLDFHRERVLELTKENLSLDPNDPIFTNKIKSNTDYIEEHEKAIKVVEQQVKDLLDNKIQDEKFNKLLPVTDNKDSVQPQSNVKPTLPTQKTSNILTPEGVAKKIVEKGETSLTNEEIKFKNNSKNNPLVYSEVDRLNGVTSNEVTTEDNSIGDTIGAEDLFDEPTTSVKEDKIANIEKRRLEELNSELQGETVLVGNLINRAPTEGIIKEVKLVTRPGFYPDLGFYASNIGNSVFSNITKTTKLYSKIQEINVKYDAELDKLNVPVEEGTIGADDLFEDEESIIVTAIEDISPIHENIDNTVIEEFDESNQAPYTMFKTSGFAKELLDEIEDADDIRWENFLSSNDSYRFSDYYLEVVNDKHSLYDSLLSPKNKAYIDKTGRREGVFLVLTDKNGEYIKDKSGEKLLFTKPVKNVVSALTNKQVISPQHFSKRNNIPYKKGDESNNDSEYSKDYKKHLSAVKEFREKLLSGEIKYLKIKEKGVGVIKLDKEYDNITNRIVSDVNSPSKDDVEYKLPIVGEAKSPMIEEWVDNKYSGNTYKLKVGRLYAIKKGVPIELRSRKLNIQEADHIVSLYKKINELLKGDYKTNKLDIDRLEEEIKLYIFTKFPKDKDNRNDYTLYRTSKVLYYGKDKEVTINNIESNEEFKEFLLNKVRQVNSKLLTNNTLVTDNTNNRITYREFLFNTNGFTTNYPKLNDTQRVNSYYIYNEKDYLTSPPFKVEKVSNDIEATIPQIKPEDSVDKLAIGDEITIKSQPFRVKSIIGDMVNMSAMGVDLSRTKEELRSELGKELISIKNYNLRLGTFPTKKGRFTEKGGLEFKRRITLAKSYSTNKTILDTLSPKLISFLDRLNVSVEFKDDIKKYSNANSLTDLLYKTIQINNNFKEEGLVKEVAYVAYSFLGKKNKIRTDLISSITKIPNYTTIYNTYKGRNPQLNDYKIKELIVVDFIADAIKNNYEVPNDSYINRQADYWGIKGNSYLEKRIKYFLNRLKRFITNLFISSPLNRQELQDLLDDLANDIINNNFNKFGSELSSDQQLTNYEETIKRDSKAKEIVDNFQKLGLLLTGSLSLRKQGTLYRSSDENLHDLDFTLTSDNHGDYYSELITNLDKDMQGASKMGKNFIYQGFIRDLSKNYKKHPIISQIKELYPTFKIVNAFPGLNSKDITISGTINEHVIDIFFVSSNELDTNEKSFQDWQPIFKAKLNMGRAKDIRDFANYKPFNTKKDIIGETKGLRHFNFEFIKSGIENIPYMKNWYKDRFGGESFEVVKDLIDGDAFGQFYNGVVTLYEKAEIGTGYHEAFHKVTQQYLTSKQRNSLYNELRNSSIPKYKRLTDLQAEEILAEDFRNFMLSGQKRLLGKPYRNTIFRKIYNFLRSLLTSKKSISEVYSKLASKQGFSNSKKRDKVRGFSKLNRTIIGYSESESKEIFDTISKRLFDILLNKNRSIAELMESSDSVELFNKAYQQVRKDLIVTFENTEDGSRAEEVLNDILPESKWLKDIIPAHKKYLSSLGVGISTVDNTLDNQDNLDNEDTLEGDTEGVDAGRDNRDYIPANEINSVTTLSKNTKLLIATLPRMEAKDKPYLNSLGEEELVDFRKTYQYILYNLKGLSTPEQMYNKLTELAESNPSIYTLLNRLGAPSELGGQSFNKMRGWGEFTKDFSKSYNTGTISMIDPTTGKIYQIDANKENLKVRVLDKWRSSIPNKIIINGEDSIPLEVVNIKNKVEYFKAIGVTFEEYEEEELEKLIADDDFKRIKKTIYDKVNSGEAVNDLTKLDLNSDVSRLLDIASERSKEIIELSYRNPTGKTIYVMTQHNYFNLIGTAINTSKDWEELISSFPQLDTIYNQGSLWLSSMYPNKGERDINNSFDVSTVSGVRIALGDGGNTTSLTIGDKITQEVNDLLLTGKASVPRPSDKSTELSAGVKININGSKLFIPIGEKEVVTKDVKDYFKTRLDGELARIRAFNNDGVGNNIDIYNKNAGNWGLFDSILSDKTKSKFKDYLTNEDELTQDDYDIVNKDLEVYLNKLTLTNKKLMSNLGLLTKTSKDNYPGFSKELTDSYTVDSLLQAFTVNHLIQTIEHHLIFIGDPALYKDEFKRISAYSGTKDFSSNSEGVHDWINKHLADGDSEVTNEFNVVIREDVVNKSKQYKKYLNSLEKIVGREKAIQMLAPYTKQTEADAQAYITYHGVRKMKIKAKQWTNLEEEQYWWEVAWGKRDKGEELTKSELDLLKTSPGGMLTVVKGQYAGPQNYELPNGYKGKKGLYAQAFHKYSLLPLYPRLVKGTNMEGKLEDMIKNNITYEVFGSGSKVGSLTKDDRTLPSFYDETGDVSISVTPTQKLSWDYLGIQVYIAPKAKKKVVFGSQFRKLIESNIFNNGVSSIPGMKEIHDDYIKTIDTMINNEWEGLKEELGVQELLNDKGEIEGFKYLDFTKLEKLIKEEGESRQLADNLIDSIETIDKLDEFNNIVGKELKYPIDSLVNRNKIEALLMSLVNSRLTRQTMPGDGMIQVAGTGWEKKGKRINVEESNELLGYRTDPITGKTLPMQIKVPANAQYKQLLDKYGGLDKLNQAIKDEKVDKRLLTLVGYRIPTQGLNSIDFMEIVGFLPESAGNSIILPSEVVAKSGGDFDVDKLNIFRPNFKVVNPNKTREEFINRELKKFNTTADSQLELTNEDELDNLLDKYTDNDEAITDIRDSVIVNLNKQYLSIPQKDVEIEYISSNGKSKKALQNKIIELSKNILEHPDNFNQLITPNTVDDLLEIVEEIREARGSTKVSKKVTSVFEFPHIMDQFKYFLGGKAGVGIAAVHNTFHTLFQQANVTLDSKITKEVINSKGKKVEVEANRSYFKSNGEYKPIVGVIQPGETVAYSQAGDVYSVVIDKIGEEVLTTAGHKAVRVSATHTKTNARIDYLVGENGNLYDTNTTEQLLGKLGNGQGKFRSEYAIMSDKISLGSTNDVTGRLISDVISQFINAYVDVAKDPFYKDLNMGTDTAYIGFYLIHMGVDIRTISYFLNQPIILEYTEALRNNKSLVLKANGVTKSNWEILNTVKNNYITRLKEFDNFKPLGEGKYKIYTPEDNELLKSYINPSEDSIDFLQTQLQLLDNFVQYKKDSDNLTDLTRTLNMDTSKSKDLGVLDNKLELVKKIEELFIGIRDKVKSSTIIGSFDKLGETSKLFTELFLTEDTRFKDVRKKILSNISPLTKDFSRINNLINNDFIGWITQVYSTEANAKLIPSMFYGENSIPNRLIRVKKIVKDNPLINELQAQLGGAKDDISNVSGYTRRLTSHESNVLTSSWRELLEYQGEGMEEVQAFANDLIGYGILQGGLNNSPITFTGLIPYDIYGGIVKQAIDKYKIELGLGKVDFEDFMDRFYMKNIHDSTVVPFYKLDAERELEFKLREKYVLQRIVNNSPVLVNTNGETLGTPALQRLGYKLQNFYLQEIPISVTDSISELSNDISEQLENDLSDDIYPSSSEDLSNTLGVEDLFDLPVIDKSEAITNNRIRKDYPTTIEGITTKFLQKIANIPDKGIIMEGSVTSYFKEVTSKYGKAAGRYSKETGSEIFIEEGELLKNNPESEAFIDLFLSHPKGDGNIMKKFAQLLLDDNVILVDTYQLNLFDIPIINKSEAIPTIKGLLDSGMSTNDIISMKMNQGLTLDEISSLQEDKLTSLYNSNSIVNKAYGLEEAQELYDKVNKAFNISEEDFMKGLEQHLNCK